MSDIILLDLDGTLTDPKIGITTSVQYALAKLGIKEESLDKLTPFIGPPLIKAFMEFYSLSEENARKGVEYYRERFSKVGLYENAVYPGIPEMLQALRAKGKKLVIATSKPTIYSVKIVEHFNLYQYFDLVIGSNLDGTRLEKGEVIEAVLAELGEVDKDTIIMVGDRKHDIIGARENGLKVIAVAYGYGPMEELSVARPDAIVASVQELRELLLK
ncbi:MAG: HAD family hydrolase [Negativicutes bacterium]|nr:HAD family hydrolase [Negativicutes bacterium]